MALKFKTDQPATPGCKYAVVFWDTGAFLPELWQVGGRKNVPRRLLSCHKTLQAAQRAAGRECAKVGEREAKATGKAARFVRGGQPRCAIYAVATGKVVKGSMQKGTRDLDSVTVQW